LQYPDESPTSAHHERPDEHIGIAALLQARERIEYALGAGRIYAVVIGAVQELVSHAVSAERSARKPSSLQTRFT